jgi:hypothetical protein
MGEEIEKVKRVAGGCRWLQTARAALGMGSHAR